MVSGYTNHGGIVSSYTFQTFGIPLVYPLHIPTPQTSMSKIIVL
ncbi:MAG: hypothetical protein RJA07_698 [Bacteroidota bacterium]|jgi:hypothetical protein